MFMYVNDESPVKYHGAVCVSGIIFSFFVIL